jgi:hypothetical protein
VHLVNGDGRQKRRRGQALSKRESHHRGGDQQARIGTDFDEFAPWTIVTPDHTMPRIAGIVPLAASNASHRAPANRPGRPANLSRPVVPDEQQQRDSCSSGERAGNERANRRLPLTRPTRDRHDLREHGECGKWVNPKGQPQTCGVQAATKKRGTLECGTLEYGEQAETRRAIALVSSGCIGTSRAAYSSEAANAVRRS